ncbi:hypothetical protein JHK82_054788 [Glycine max]|uniref:Uncharacterized protein n=2 Tax=Glycine subgen. Soja TaxID=1462606 RepID=A0A0R0EG35_SOYBN|nr:hypothetical protein JHK86_054633 [Glycine max]KAG5073424.1 hypothetical protein JHK84_054655 [Glycine max]KAG5076093.1 hypothetical protein JHK82_054788 [Glycine max]KAH1033839.1 hypothetical protein GYH30_054314 [Glycine max]RZB41745.1 hypothetical protein D0Y65_052667 [Glycine soja]
MKNLYSLAIVYSCFFFYEMILTCLHVATIWRTLLVMLAVWILKMFWILPQLCSINTAIYQPLYEMAQGLTSWMEQKKKKLGKM